MRKAIIVFFGLFWGGIIIAGIIAVIWFAASQFVNPFAQAQRTNSHFAELSRKVRHTPPDMEALNELIQSLHSSDSFVKSAAAEYIGKAGPAAAPAVKELVEILNGSDGYGSNEAAIALGEIGPAAVACSPFLIKAILKHPDSSTGWSAAEALGKVAETNDATAASTLQNAAKSSNQLMQSSARDGLRSLQMRKRPLEPGSK